MVTIEKNIISEPSRQQLKGGKWEDELLSWNNPNTWGHFYSLNLDVFPFLNWSISLFITLKPKKPTQQS